MEFGVLKGGDTGAACAIIGNYALRKDKYDGLVDMGAGKAVLRNVDQQGGLGHSDHERACSALGDVSS